MVKKKKTRLPMQDSQETRVQSLGQEDPLKEEMATHFSILAWKIPWTEEPGGLQSMGCKESGRTKQLRTNCEVLKESGISCFPVAIKSKIQTENKRAK